MKRLLFPLCFVLVAALGCSEKLPSKSEPIAKPAAWEVTVAFIEGAADAGVEVRTPGETSFVNWDGGKPIAAGSHIKTGPKVRVRIALDAGEIILNHDTILELIADEGRTLRLHEGHAVFDLDSAGKEPHIQLPTGEIILQGTKLSAVANPEASVVTVSQGVVEVRHGEESFQAHAGQEMVLPKEGAPRISGAPNLGQSVGWSELVDPSEEGRIEVARGLGKLMGRPWGGGSERRLDLVNHGVDVKVQGNMAYTEIHESFKNPSGERLEGVYRFPLPANAQISKLSLKVGNTWMEGEFVENQRAEAIWRDIIRQRRDPAMLKWKHGNLFELRIFPIEPHAIREVKIGYVQELKPASEGYSYTYAMPVDTAGLIKAGKFDFKAAIYQHDPTMPLRVDGYAAEVSNSANKKDEAVTLVSYKQSEFFAAGDLNITFSRKKNPEFESYAFAGRKTGEGAYALMTIRPEFKAKADAISKRDFMLIADTSYSRTGAAWDLQKQLLSRMVAEMDPLDRVLGIACATTCAPIGKTEFQAPHKAVADDFEASLATMKASGSSNIVEALRVAEQVRLKNHDPARELHIIYLTDGVASAGELRTGEIAKAAKAILIGLDARMSVVNVGGDVDPDILNTLAEAGRGSVVELDPAATRTAQALDILAGHYGGVMTDVSYELPAGMTDVQLPKNSSLRAGEEVALLGRFKGEVSGDLVLRANLGSEKVERRFALALKEQRMPENAFVPRAWASRQIKVLELGGDVNKREIVKLSQRFGVLSRYTTLLALESQDMMDEYGVRKTKRDKWEGEKAPSAGDGAADGADEEPAAERSLDDVLTMGGEGTSKEMIPLGSGMASGESEDLDVSESSGRKGAGGAPKAKKSKRMEAPRSTSKSSAGFFDDNQMTPRPQKRRSRTPRRYPVAKAKIGPAKPATPAEAKRVDSRKRALSRDSSNRSKRMRLIRTILRAGQVDEAMREVDQWLGMNAMDPEALVQKSQILSYKGEIAEALVYLESAMDAAPRGKWLQERIQSAYESLGERELACAHRVSLAGIGSGMANINECGVVSDLAPWGIAKQSSSVVQERDSRKLKGDFTVDATWSGAGDIDVLIVEPDGRLLSWMSQRRRLKTGKVRQAERDTLELRAARDGTYGVRIVRADGGSDPVQVKVTVRARGQKKVFDVVLADSAVDVAEAQFHNSAYR